MGSVNLDDVFVWYFAPHCYTYHFNLRDISNSSIWEMSEHRTQKVKFFRDNIMEGRTVAIRYALCHLCGQGLILSTLFYLPFS